MTLNYKFALPITTSSLIAMLLFLGCSTSIGLNPVMPKHGRELAPEELVLQWEPASEVADETCYQVLIQDESDSTVYSETMLKETRHVVTIELAPGMYRWSVRPLYLHGEEWTFGQWMYRKWMKFFVVAAAWGKGPYKFRIVQPEPLPE